MNPSHKLALQKGRERAARRRRKQSVKRVLDYQTFTQADLEYWERRWKARGAGLSREEEIKAAKPRPRPPELPSDYDYAVAREEGAIF